MGNFTIQDWGTNFLFQGKISLIFPDKSELNLDASELGQEGISTEYGSDTVDRLPVIFGDVGVLKIARAASIKVSINKTLPVAEAWVKQGISNALVEGGVVTTDDNGLSYDYTKVSISQDGFTSNGTQAAYTFTVTCVQLVNGDAVI